MVGFTKTFALLQVLVVVFLLLSDQVNAQCVTSISSCPLDLFNGTNFVLFGSTVTVSTIQQTDIYGNVASYPTAFTVPGSSLVVNHGSTESGTVTASRVNSLSLPSIYEAYTAILNYCCINTLIDAAPTTTVTIVPGVSCFDTTTFPMMNITNDLILDGQNNSDSVFFIQVGADFNVTANIKLINRAKPCNVFFVITGAFFFYNEGRNISGNYLVNGDARIQSASTKKSYVNGRILSLTGSVTVDSTGGIVFTNCTPQCNLSACCANDTTCSYLSDPAQCSDVYLYGNVSCDKCQTMFFPSTSGCQVNYGNGTCLASFSYNNANPFNISINPGYNNLITPSESFNVGQPWFLISSNNNFFFVFARTFDCDGGSVTWHIQSGPNSVDTVVTSSSTQCQGACCFEELVCIAPVGIPDCGSQLPGVARSLGSFTTCDRMLYPTVCIYKGACCLPNNTCLYDTPSVCASLAGTFNGLGVQCQTVACCATCNITNRLDYMLLNVTTMINGALGSILNTDNVNRGQIIQRIADANTEIDNNMWIERGLVIGILSVVCAILLVSIMKWFVMSMYANSMRFWINKLFVHYAPYEPRRKQKV
jgi:hypothetical protein